MSSECLTEPGHFIAIVPIHQRCTCLYVYIQTTSLCYWDQNLGLLQKIGVVGWMCLIDAFTARRCEIFLTGMLKKGRDLCSAQTWKATKWYSILIAFLLAICKLMEEVLLAGPASKIRTTLWREQACSVWGQNCTGKILVLLDTLYSLNNQNSTDGFSCTEEHRIVQLPVSPTAVIRCWLRWWAAVWTAVS